ncbi:MAG: hypothetical protein KKG03_00540 [Gammaproteobacteria bacterium]|nr:hypothetical protein [Sideroxydans sp.]MBU4044709.1 hypothetical protein [Gammaproteobacteria bacterium]MBU4150118.1 hypothetical protein [Gammaproteobacteria bacterium]
MEITLNLDSDKREIFLEYFHAAYRKLSGRFFSPEGQAGYREDGNYEIQLKFPLQISTGSELLIWKILVGKDGALGHLDVSSDTIPEVEWGAAATKFVNEVLVAALSGISTKYFYRHYFCRIGADLDGEYWLPGFRFAPAMSEDSNSFLRDAERYLILDQEVEAIDQIHGSDIATERALLYAARLSLILDVALYSPISGMRWFYAEDETGKLVSKLEPLGFASPNPPLKMPKKKSESRLGEYAGSVLDEARHPGLLKCPVETRKILRGLEKCPENVKEAFDSCARLYQTALVAGREFPTIRLSYMVGAVEAVVQKVSGYSSSFSEFIRKEAELNESANELLNYLYSSVRSAHFHGGQFPLGEYQSSKWSLGLSDHTQTKNFNFDFSASRLLRKAIMNWVLREIASKADHEK